MAPPHFHANRFPVPRLLLCLVAATMNALPRALCPPLPLISLNPCLRPLQTLLFLPTPTHLACPNAPPVGPPVALPHTVPKCVSPSRARLFRSQTSKPPLPAHPHPFLSLCPSTLCLPPLGHRSPATPVLKDFASFTANVFLASCQPFQNASQKAECKQCTGRKVRWTISIAVE